MRPSLAVACLAVVCVLVPLAPAAVAAVAATPPTTAPPTTVVIHDVTVLDGTGGPALPHRAVVVRGDRIAEVRVAGPLPPPEVADGEVTVVDGAGRFLIPGLWDMHVHPDDPEIWHVDPPREEKERFLPLFVAHGVLGVRDMGGDLDLLHDWRARIRAGELLGPHIVCGGPLVDGPEPMWPGSVAVSTPEEGRAAVDELIGRGVDFVKVYSLLPREAFFAIAERCRERGVPFSGHVPRGVSPSEASDAGIASEEHLLGMMVATADPARQAELIAAMPDGLGLAEQRRERIRSFTEAGSEALTRELAETFARNGTTVVPTMILWKRRAWFDAEHPRVKPFLPLMPRYIQRWWDPSENIHLKDLSGVSMEAEQLMYARNLEILAALHEAGVPLLTGTDTGGNPHLFPGVSVHDELEILVEAGLTNAEALRAATSGCAAFLGLEDRGTIEAGKVADLVLLDADPLLDITHTREIEAVVRAGRLLDREALDALLVPAP